MGFGSKAQKEHLVCLFKVIAQSFPHTYAGGKPTPPALLLLK